MRTRKAVWAIMVGCMALLGLPLLASAQATWHVATNGLDTNGGTGWGDAFASISNGLAHAQSGDTVLVSNGTYVLTATLSVSNGVTLKSVNGPAVTTVNANSSEATGRRNVLTVSGTDTLVAGLKLTGGYAWNTVAGVNMTGGTLSNCVVTGNGPNYAAVGIAVAMPSGNPLVESCLIVSNYCKLGQGGSTVSLVSGTLRNCLVAGNWLPTSGYGGGDCCAGVAQSGGRMVHCTIAGNWVIGGGVGGLLLAGGAVSNSVIYYNRNPAFPATDPVNDWNVRKTGGTMTNSCIPPGIADAGNVTADPRFVDPANGNYRLLPGSPALDAAAGVGTPADVNGAPRPTDGDGDGNARPDIGCYESDAADSGTLRCGFIAEPAVAIGTNTAVLTARVAGGNTNIVSYNWDLGNGQTAEGGVVTGFFGVGAWTVTLTVTNDAAAGATLARAGSLYVAPETICVATNGSGTFPFDTWLTAATNLQDGIDIAAVTGGVCSTVRAADGEYLVIYCRPIQLYKGCRVVSANGPEGARITRIRDASTYRLVEARHADAVLEGFTLTNGFMGTSAQWNYLGGAVRLYAGTLRDCLVIDNQAGGSGGGVLMDSGLIDRCRIVNNRAASSYSNGGGGGILMYGGTVRNSLIVSNTTGVGSQYGNGGGVSMWVAGCRLENCTIVGNLITNTTAGAAYSGAGLYRRYDTVTVTNCIVWFNLKADLPDDIYNNGAATTIGFTCSPDVADGTQNNTTNDPAFLSSDAEDYRLGTASPCREAGTNLAWMTTESLDLAGLPRLIKACDMGAYEWQPPAGTVLIIQ